MFLISIFQTPVPISYPCNVLPGEELMPSEHHCLEDISCTLEQRQNLYSRIDGLCNNLKQPTNGGAGTNFLHLVEKRKIIHKQLKGALYRRIHSSLLIDVRLKGHYHRYKLHQFF